MARVREADNDRDGAVRISCHTINDFLKNLDSADEVIGGRVHANKNENKDSESPRKYVILQTSALIRSNEFETLLECGVNCGYDLLTGDGHMEGTEKCDEWMDELSRYCESKNLSLLPGILNL